ncbi:MAG: methionyl-tRNA formyltransferase [Bacteroidia bacterium]|nr:MAG: methionyl-tRNA formyltransferase [Bacteroidia bacterium]
MEINSIRIVYMGSPEFAVRPLQKLLETGYQVVGVITAPDRPAGRGKKIRRSAVKDFLIQHSYDIPVLQPENLKDPAFVKELQELNPDLQVVVAFRMLPRVVWSIPSLGTINLHASLLPQYRGAAPINHAIINGERETGVTTFLIDEQIDTGNILLQEPTAIDEQETAGELRDRLMEIGASLLLETVRQMSEGNLKAKSQDGYSDPMVLLKKAPKIFKEDCRIHWNLPGRDVNNLIRGLSPYPGAFTYLSRNEEEALLCKIYSATFEALPHTDPPGSIHTDGKRRLEVAVKDGVLDIQTIQLEGKRKMDARDFLAGFSFSSGQSRFS